MSSGQTAPKAEPPARGTTPANAAADLRAARAAAAEARLRGDQPTSSSSSSGLAGDGDARPAVPLWQPTEKSDDEKRKEYTRLLYRGIVRDNGYKQASDAVETLVKITRNVLDHPDLVKYRELRAANTSIKSKVLDVRGGHEYLITEMSDVVHHSFFTNFTSVHQPLTVHIAVPALTAHAVKPCLHERRLSLMHIQLGFRTRTVNFEKQYVLEPTFRRMHELKVGHEILAEALPEIQSRLTSLSSSTNLHASDEAARRARALAEYEADRDLVKERVRREKMGREARERAAAEAEARGEQDQGQGQGQDNQVEQATAGHDDLGQGLDDDDGNDDDDDDDEDEDDNGDCRTMGRGTRWGKGQKLGGGEADVETGGGIDEEAAVASPASESRA